MGAEPFTNLMPDYRTDARLGKVAFMKMKKFLEEKGAPKSDLFVTSTNQSTKTSSTLSNDFDCLVIASYC